MPFKSGPRKAERNEKGDLVYRCTWIGCPKSFGTAGHVRRHEKIHGGITPYACPHCGKQFGRSDVRAKHMATMHEGAEPITKSISPSGSGSQSRVEDGPSPSFHQTATTSSQPPINILRTQFAQPSPVTNLNHNLTPENAMHWPTNFALPDLNGTMKLDTEVSSIFTSSTAHHHMLTGAPDIMLQPSNTTPFSISATPSNGFLDPITLSAGPSAMDYSQAGVLDASQSLPDVNMLFPSTWESFDHIFGWDLDNGLDLDVGLPNNMYEGTTIGPVSSTDTLSTAWLLCTTPRQGSPVNGVETAPMSTFKQIIRNDPFGRNDDNPWPHIFRPKVPDRPLTLGGVKAKPRPPYARAGPNKVSQASRNAMLSLIYLSHQSLWLVPAIEDFPDHETLSDFVDLYFEHFHPTFPVLHKATFQETDTPAVLLLAVAAIGATFAEQDFKPLAVALNELVRRMITWMRASDQRSKFDRHALQAYVLQTALGLACGSREMFLHSEIFRCSVVTTCRRMHLLRPGPSATDDLYAREIVPTIEDRHRAYVEDESRRRLGWGIYLLDAQMAMYGTTTCFFSISEAGVPLPGDSSLWDAPDAASWAAAADRIQFKAHDPVPSTFAPFLHVLSATLAGRPLAPLNDFAGSILAHTLYRLSLDAYLLQRALGSDGPLDQPELVSYLPPILASKPEKVLLALAQPLFPSPLLSHLQLTPLALYHHSHLQFTRPGLIEKVKLASGKSEPNMTKQGGIKWLKEWVKNGTEVRRVFWHSAILNALLTEFPRGAIAEVFWTLDAALMLWAVLKYGQEKLRSLIPADTIYSSSWLDSAPPGLWLERGGTILFPFLGSSATLTVGSCLTFFINRLDQMPWGLAGLFGQVLGRLLEDEKRGDELH